MVAVIEKDRRERCDEEDEERKILENSGGGGFGTVHGLWGDAGCGDVAGGKACGSPGGRES